MLRLMIFASRMLDISAEVILIVDIGHQAEAFLQIVHDVERFLRAANKHVAQGQEGTAIVIENFLNPHIA
ncbi:MAG: hypothetical protein B7Y36_17875 [Novosphingobium sp. 28-62-57]|nr:MAG: hypothetical protein B7Z36_03175 [Novosphingobium sp. 12-63-9]OYZ08175.1 MAG: hypothetical protein B7Y36_17875 [Novosphingobium sp. 28-62-57]OZA36145.1 MAG: hypothetical protein B7X92_07545 [Novosphingobium sp. 17-62-9]